MHVLVTGGCGYVGSALVPRLQATPVIDRVTVLDALETGSLRNLVGAPITNGFEFHEGDVGEYPDVESAMAGVDAVVHLAAVNRADSEAVGKADTYTVNLDGTWNVLNAARTHDVENVVYASSSRVYGTLSADRIDGSATPQPFDPYTETKFEAERLLREFAGEPDRTGTALRLGTVYGYAPGVRFDLAPNRYVFQALTGGRILLSGDGDSWRPLIHVQDAANALAHAVRSPHRWSDPVYDVGSTVEQYRLSDVAEIVRNEVNPDLDIDYVGEAARTVSHRLTFEDFEAVSVPFEWTLSEGVRDLADRFIDPAQRHLTL
jgi:nucleoside-diphosphate-sugar epimerase